MLDQCVKNLVMRACLCAVATLAMSSGAAFAQDAEIARGHDDSMEHHRDASDLNGLLGLHGTGLEMSLWGWAYYAVSDQSDNRDSWGAEIELDATQTIANRISIAADVEFFDYDDEKKGNVEQ